jgi:hypothetical protein
VDRVGPDDPAFENKIRVVATEVSQQLIEQKVSNLVGDDSSADIRVRTLANEVASKLIKQEVEGIKGRGKIFLLGVAAVLAIIGFEWRELFSPIKEKLTSEIASSLHRKIDSGYSKKFVFLPPDPNGARNSAAEADFLLFYALEDQTVSVSIMAAFPPGSTTKLRIIVDGVPVALDHDENNNPIVFELTEAQPSKFQLRIDDALKHTNQDPNLHNLQIIPEDLAGSHPVSVECVVLVANAKGSGT